MAQALENQYLVKHFYPWGEKGFNNIINNEQDVYPDVRYRDVPVLMCHDQEPLDFDLYSDKRMLQQLDQIPQPHQKDIRYHLDKDYKNLNLRWVHPEHKANYWVLLHSELNSAEVKLYEETGLFKCAYWWAHAPITIDWYRFARYDTRLNKKNQDIKANFLVYARGKTGKRKYRKEFLKKIHRECLMYF